MLVHPEINPVIIQIGPLAIRWYGVMYLAGFAAGYFIIRHLARWRRIDLSKDALSDLMFYAVLGVVLGGRLGYVLFYDLAYYLRHPLELLAVWQGGMSFHGGLLGVIAGACYFCWRYRQNPLAIGDLLVTAAPVGLGLGRVGNFINGELWGRTTTMPWGMVFRDGGPLPRHPSQLYQAGLEGVLLFAVLWLLHRRQARTGTAFFTFFLLYGMYRWAMEFFREPDAHLGLLAAGWTMGQWLSLPMIAFGLGGLGFLARRKSQS